MRDTKRSLAWITNLLTDLNIPFQIAGGLAAKAYGVTRELELLAYKQILARPVDLVDIQAIKLNIENKIGEKTS